MSLLDPWPKAAVACPTCGYELLVSIARIDAEGLPWCTHDGSVTYGGTPYPTWTRMVSVPDPPLSHPVVLNDYRHLVFLADPAATLDDYKPFVFIPRATDA